MKIIIKPNEIGNVKYFGHVLIGEYFERNGATYKKRSTKTADILTPFPVKIAYFSCGDKVKIVSNPEEK